MPSSFTSVLSSALESSSRLPVSVLVRSRPPSGAGFSRPPVRRLRNHICPRPQPSRAEGRPILTGRSPSGRRPDAIDLGARCRNINLPSIGYACRPRLRARLTLGGFTFPRKPGAFGGRDSHPAYRYSFRHDRSRLVQRPSSVRLRPIARRSPTAVLLLPAASVRRLVPFIIGAGPLDR